MPSGYGNALLGKMAGALEFKVRGNENKRGGSLPIAGQAPQTSECPCCKGRQRSCCVFRALGTVIPPQIRFRVACQKTQKIGLSGSAMLPLNGQRY